MDIGGGSISTSSNKIDVNTDDIQKVVLSLKSEEVQAQDPLKASDVEIKSPLQHLMQGEEKEAKQELLKNFVKMVAESGNDVALSGETGRKNSELMNEMKLLFGENSLKSDEVKISAEAKLGTMVQAASIAMNTNKELERKKTLELEKADRNSELEEYMLLEKGSVRNKIQTLKPNDENLKETRKFQDEYSDRELKDKKENKDNSDHQKKRDQNELYEKEDEAVIAIKQIRQRAIEETKNELEEEMKVEEINEDEIRGKSEQIEKKRKEDKTDQIIKLPVKKEEALTFYSDLYRRNLMTENKNLNELKEIENNLIKKYEFTARNIRDIQLAVKKTVKIEIRDKIKEAIVNKQLAANNKIDTLTADTKLNRFTDYFVSNLLLGGTDFGGFDDTFQGLIDKAMYFASKDLANFSVEELQYFVTKESLAKDKDKSLKIKEFESKVNELNSITNNPKITEEWAQIAMEAFMKDFGLAKEKMDLHRNDTVGTNINAMAGEANTGGQQQREKPFHGYEFDSKDEKDIFLNRLRALYLQKALNPGMKGVLKTEFKLRRLKNGLLRMGILTDVLNEQVKKEAELIAMERTREMLNEALEERASMYVLKGPAFQLIEDKIKGILRNAEKLGQEIGAEEFLNARDKINHKIYELTKKEMGLIEVRLSDQDFPQLVVKYRDMQKLIERLKAESNIRDEYEANSKFSNITMAGTV